MVVVSGGSDESQFESSESLHTARGASTARSEPTPHSACLVPGESKLNHYCYNMFISIHVRAIEITSLVTTFLRDAAEEDEQVA